MKSFEEGFIEQQPINQRLLQTIRLIGENLSTLDALLDWWVIESP